MPKHRHRDETDLRIRVVRALDGRKGRARHLTELQHDLKLAKGHAARAELLAVLCELAEAQQVLALPGLRFRLPARPGKPAPAPPSPERSRGAREREGVLTLHPRGFGFVATAGEALDVFISPEDLFTAMHGDRVRVRFERSPKGLSGRVLDVLARGVRYVGGQLHVTSDGAWLEPDDERLRMAILAKGRLPDGARTGQGALAEVMSYPARPGDPLTVRVIEVFEPEAFVEHEIRRILLKENVVESLGDEAQREAAELAEQPVTLGDREDLRHLPLLTIDPADARDHDDAVFAERVDEGFRVVVAIADVSFYVREGSVLDREALERGCTIYLPTRAVPMLPAAISSDMASLLPDRDRYTLAIEIVLDRDGGIVRHRFIEGLMRARACLSYEAVAHALGLLPDGPKDERAFEHLPQLQTLLEVSGVLREQRRRRGSLELELPEPKVRVDDETGHPIDIEHSRRDPGVARAYNLIEELMLLANEVTARELATRGLPAIYRVHGEPDPDRIETFCALARALGHDLNPERATDPRVLAAFLRRIHGKPEAGTLGYLMLRAMKQATYDTVCGGHFGLAAEHYLHFTSPIRRYPDLAVHRVVRSLVRSEPIEKEGALLRRMQHAAEKASQLERRAMSIEREVVDLYGAFLMRDRVGDTYDATVTGVTEHGFYASLDAPFVDVHCRLASLPRDEYALDAYGVRLSGRLRGTSFGLGDRIRVVIQDVSIAQRKILVVPEGTSVEQERRPVTGGAEHAHRREKRRDRDKQREAERAHGRKARKARKSAAGATGGAGGHGPASERPRKGTKGRRR